MDREVKEEYRAVRVQEYVKIDLNIVKSQLRKMANWKAPGPDGVHGFWIKEFTKMHENIAEHSDEMPQ